MPAVSIIVPIFNTEQYLSRCLDSIESQTFNDWECILINDGSTDKSENICNEYANKDSRFKVINQKNSGVSAARNAGLDVAKGEWIGFVDSDDWIEPNMYEFLYQNAKDNNADVVICGFVKQSKKRVTKMCDRQTAQELLFNRNGFGGFSVLRLTANKIIKSTRFDTSMTYLEDLKFFYEVFHNCNKVFWNNEPLYNYYQRNDSVTNKFGLTNDAKKAIEYLDTLIKTESKRTIKKSIICSKTNLCMNIATMYISNNEYKHVSLIYLREQLGKHITTILFSNQFSTKEKCWILGIRIPFLTKLLAKYLQSANKKR